MRGTSGLAFIALALAATLGCAGRQTYMVPPRIDLARHELIGVVEFSSSAEGELGALATRRFTEAARQDQGLVRMVDCGAKADLERDSLLALGRERGVRTILTGKLTVSEVRPNVRIAPNLRSGSLAAQVDATLEVQLIETATGASIWNRSARATQSVGQISVFGGNNIVFDADDPENAYGGLVDELVAQVTQDFRATWERR